MCIFTPHCIKYRTKHIINVQGQTTYVRSAFPCRCENVFVHVSVHARGQHQVSLITSGFLEQDLVMNMSWLTQPYGSSCLCILHAQISSSWCHMGPRELNSGPCVHATWTLMTIPLSQPQTESFIFPDRFILKNLTSNP